MWGLTNPVSMYKLQDIALTNSSYSIYHYKTSRPQYWTIHVLYFQQQVEAFRCGGGGGEGEGGGVGVGWGWGVGWGRGVGWGVGVGWGAWCQSDGLPRPDCLPDETAGIKSLLGDNLPRTCTRRGLFPTNCCLSIYDNLSLRIVVCLYLLTIAESPVSD